MKKILIIGANGQIGKILTNKMKDTGDFTPVAMIRKDEQKSYFEDLGVDTKLVSLEGEVEDIEKAVEGLDGVVFAAGSGGSTGQDKTLTVDLDGAVKAMEAAKAKGVKRFVMVSALGADDRSFWDKSGIKPYYVAKYFADRTLKNIGLDYTIVRPGMLKDGDGTGKITLQDPMSAESVKREDVAEVILAALQQHNTIGKVIEFNNGENEIKEAIAAV
ncbi:SDR family oxidoreductase [Fulvivirga sediminis]|uniref:SDR family oxidoreductase n=1 Tax=Fulvivirga sediminis TaxID=2803949 RepID=A0A937FAJ9_9BACT|nr:SDR family oxidoreductase [Fulvivirga sediminis]MBL3657644.1 SDR family oxidoreductase [Fulvivirga sediminis]